MLIAISGYCEEPAAWCAQNLSCTTHLHKCLLQRNLEQFFVTAVAASPHTAHVRPSSKLGTSLLLLGILQTAVAFALGFPLFGCSCTLPTAMDCCGISAR
jgi:hypothetical protein